MIPNLKEKTISFGLLSLSHVSLLHCLFKIQLILKVSSNNSNQTSNKYWEETEQRWSIVKQPSIQMLLMLVNLTMVIYWFLVNGSLIGIPLIPHLIMIQLNKISFIFSMCKCLQLCIEFSDWTTELTNIWENFLETFTMSSNCTKMCIPSLSKFGMWRLMKWRRNLIISWLGILLVLLSMSCFYFSYIVSTKIKGKWLRRSLNLRKSIWILKSIVWRWLLMWYRKDANNGILIYIFTK